MQEDGVSMAAAVSTRDDGISRVSTEAAVALRAGRHRQDAAMAAAVTLQGEHDVEGGRRFLSGKMGKIKAIQAAHLCAKHSRSRSDRKMCLWINYNPDFIDNYLLVVIVITFSLSRKRNKNIPPGSSVSPLTGG
jgi:hypothetical protein